MSDEPKKIIVDEDWKAEAQAEKQRLAEETSAAGQPAQGAAPAASFIELINLLAMQALAGLGLMAGPDGQRIPPNMAAAKHAIDMLQVVDDKTRGNLTDEEKKVLDQVLYEVRMQFVQMNSAGSAGAPGGAVPPTTPGA